MDISGDTTIWLAVIASVTAIAQNYLKDQRDVRERNDASKERHETKIEVVDEVKTAGTAAVAASKDVVKEIVAEVKNVGVAAGEAATVANHVNGKIEDLNKQNIALAEGLKKLQEQFVESAKVIQDLNQRIIELTKSGQETKEKVEAK